MLDLFVHATLAQEARELGWASVKRHDHDASTKNTLTALKVQQSDLICAIVNSDKEWQQALLLPIDVIRPGAFMLRPAMVAQTLAKGLFLEIVLKNMDLARLHVLCRLTKGTNLLVVSGATDKQDLRGYHDMVNLLSLFLSPQQARRVILNNPQACLRHSAARRSCKRVMAIFDPSESNSSDLNAGVSMAKPLPKSGPSCAPSTHPTTSSAPAKLKARDSSHLRDSPVKAKVARVDDS